MRVIGIDIDPAWSKSRGSIALTSVLSAMNGIAEKIDEFTEGIALMR